MNEFEPLRFVHGDAILESTIVRPTNPGPHSAVLMVPGAAGPGDSFRQAMRDLAAQGYVVVGIDMYGADADIATPEAAGEYFAALLQNPQLLRERIVGWFETVSRLPGVDAKRVAAIGYCFGGKCVLELARSGADVAAAISFHGLLATHAPALPGAVNAKVAIWTGGRDPYVPDADLDSLKAEMDRARANYQITLFSDAQHSFTDPDHDGLREGIAYDRMAHRIAWTGALVMLDEVFNGSP